MSTQIRFFLAGACCLALMEPTPSRAGENASTSRTGQILVLENERTLEGDIIRDGSLFRVRRSIGETVIPADKVLRLCGSLEEAYAYLKTRANLRDPDERLRLARWCQQRGLREQAAAEVSAAVDLDPRRPDAQRLLQNLKRSASEPFPSKPAENQPKKPAPQIEVDMQALGQFANKVQPILMNACASCHCSDKGGSFRLTRVYGQGSNHGRAIHQNLAAVMAQVERRQWQASPFLTKAVSVHGENNLAPLKGRQTPAYRTLEEWVELVVKQPVLVRETQESPSNKAADNKPAIAQIDAAIEAKGAAQSPSPASPEGSGEKISRPGSKPDSLQPAAEGNKGEWAVNREEPKKPAGAPNRPPAEPVPLDEAAFPEEASPSETLEPADPFDPRIFNQQMHPLAQQEVERK